MGFINKCKLKHGDRYDYSLVNYSDSQTKVKIICKEHGEFEQTPKNHLTGCGCPICRESKGEKQIRLFLIDNNISFIPQYKFNNCREILPLPFDFYLPDYNICMEYDGIQHFKVVKRWGGLDGFIGRQKKDKIKNKYCIDNNIKLIRISYKENVIIELNKIYGK